LSELIDVYITNFPDKPGPPEDLKPTAVSEDTVTIQWAPPKDDGGSEIIGYVVEKREASKRTWQKVDTTEELEMEVNSLQEGQSYIFRVAAENEIGVGEFVELSKAATPKSQFGKLWSR